MNILSEEYEYQNKLVVVCKECQYFADLPAAIVHAPNCSKAHLGAQLTKRAPDTATLFGMRVEIANWLKPGQWFIRPSRRG